MDNLDALENARGSRVLVIGDVMLDDYHFVEARALNPDDHAVPNVHDLEKHLYFPGGAANVAMNLRLMGARPTLIGMTGQDEYGKILEGELKKEKVALKTVKDAKTNVKTRFIEESRGTTIVRLNYGENGNSITREQAEKMYNKINGNSLKGLKGIFLSDYGKRVFVGKEGHEFAQRFMRLGRQLGIPVFADPKPGNYREKFIGASMICSNEEEAQTITGWSFKDNDYRHILQRIYGVSGGRTFGSVCVTRGKEGVVAYDGENFYNVSVKPIRVEDHIGAGDAFFAAAGLATIGRAGLEEALQTGNEAARISCSFKYTYPVALEEIRKDRNKMVDES